MAVMAVGAPSLTRKRRYLSPGYFIMMQTGCRHPQCLSKPILASTGASAKHFASASVIKQHWANGLLAKPPRCIFLSSKQESPLHPLNQCSRREKHLRARLEVLKGRKKGLAEAQRSPKWIVLPSIPKSAARSGRCRILCVFPGLKPWASVRPAVPSGHLGRRPLR
jgi:hypothetical protein